MATVKRVVVDAIQVNGFTIEAQARNHMARNLWHAGFRPDQTVRTTTAKNHSCHGSLD